MLRVFDIARHIKDEFDHIGGVVRLIIKCPIAAGPFFSNSSDMVSFLLA